MNISISGMDSASSGSEMAFDSTSEAELSTRRSVMIRQCCVCKRIYEGGQWVMPRPEHLAEEDITHGYCEECYEDFMKAVAEYVATMHAEIPATTAV